MQNLDKGRYLTAEMVKKTSSIEIEAYSWSELGSDEMLFTDNPRQSVILTELHDKREIAQKVHVPREFSEIFSEKRRPIFPIDLTKDYQRSQEEMLFKKKRKMLDEDEAVALELAEAMERGQHVNHPSGRWKKEGATGSEQEAPAAAATKEVPPEKVAAPVLAATESSAASEPVSVSVAGDVSSHQSDAGLAELRGKAQSEGYSAGFEEGREAGAAEVNAARAVGKEEGYQIGYDEGFRVGEERGEISGEAKVQSTLGMLNEVVNQIDLVRSEILSSGQDIFLEFAKVACESILRGQLAVHDETLRSFMKQTLSPFVERSFITIETAAGESGRVISLLSEMADLQRKVRVKESSTMPSGDFRVEADNEVVIVDLKKAVEGLLETVKGSILTDHSPETDKNKKGVA